MSEDRLRKLLRYHLGGKLHLSAIESHYTSPGVPDYAYTIQGFNGWLELKHGHLAKPPVMRHTQCMWIKENIEHGGNPLIMCSLDWGDHIAYGLIHGRYADGLRAATISEWGKCMHIGAHWRTEINWDVFIHKLQNPWEVRT